MAGSRVSQFYVQVVGNPNTSGEVRVRRLYAEVLVSDVGSGPVTHNESVSQVLGITASALGALDVQTVESTLNLSSNSVGNMERPVSVADTISFSQQGARARDGDASSNLTLSDVMVAFNYVADREPCGSTLNFTQEVLTLSGIDVSQDLNLTQTVNVSYPTKVSITQFFGLYQSTATPYHMFVEHELGITDIGRVPIEHVISHTLTFTDVAQMETFIHTLAFTQAVVAGRGYWVESDLGISDELVLKGAWVRENEQDLSLSASLTYHEDSPCNRKNYTPFQGDGSGRPRQTLQDPQGSLSDRFSLYQPAVGVRSSEVILRAPELDNRDRNAYTRVQGETRGGKLRVYADQNWPKVRTLAVTIIGLTEDQVDDLHDFMSNTLGQDIGLTDWEGRLWQGIIVNPNEDAVQDGRGRWTVSFEFEGEMREDETPGDDGTGDGMAMNLTQSVTAVIE